MYIYIACALCLYERASHTNTIYESSAKDMNSARTTQKKPRYDVHNLSYIIDLNFISIKKNKKCYK